MRIFGIAALLAAAIVSGCATPPAAPTVAVSPGPGKTAEAFAADDAACKQAAGQLAAAATKAANQAAMTGAISSIAAGAAAGGSTSDAANTALTSAQGSTAANGTIQQQYDDAYKNCMYNKGNIVPGMEPPPPPPPATPAYEPPVRNHLVMQVQQQLVRLGYLSGGADGIAGRKTAAAISKYEQDHGLTVDGVSSHTLLRALQADGSPAASGSGSDGGFVMPPPPPSGGSPSPQN